MSMKRQHYNETFKRVGGKVCAGTSKVPGADR